MGDLYTITIPPELRNLLSDRTAVEVMIAALNKAADDVLEHLRQVTPKHTGETAARWRISKKATADSLVVEVSNDSVVALYIEFGTGVFAAPDGGGAGLDADLEDAYPSMRPRWVVRGNVPHFEDLFMARVMEELGARLYG